MPPKKDNKKENDKADNSGISKNDVAFKFTFTIQSEQLPQTFLMFEWFSSGDKFEKYDAGLVQNWTKKQNILTFQKTFDSIRVDDDFCKNLSNHKFYIYFINPQSSVVEDMLLLDYSSLMMARESPYFQYKSSTIKVHQLDSFSLKLSCDKQLLPQMYRQYLNPMQFQVIGALDIPFNNNDKYLPTYIRYKFYDGTIVETNSTIGQDKIIWQHKHVFLVGLMNPIQIKEKIRSNYLKFQFHDRDQVQNNQMKEDIQLFDIARAIQEEMQKENPPEEDPKKKGAKKQEKKQPPKKQTKKDTKKKDAKIAQPILPKPIESFKNNYGVAVFSLVEFLKPSVRTAKYKSPVIPRTMFEDFESRNIDLNTTARNQMQKIVFSNNYFDRDTTLVVGFTLSYPIGHFVQKYHKKQSSSSQQQPTINIDQKIKKQINNFQRVIIFLEYKNSQSIQLIQDLFYEINMKAFNLKSKREITTHLLKKEEKESIELDYLTGIQIIDPEGRIYILEGLKDRAIKKIYEKLPKDKYSTEKQKILKNTNLKFTSRLYHEFNIEIKRIRFRPSLAHILLDPSIYIKSKVDEQICENLNKISDLRKICDELWTVETMNLWPNAEILVQIQRKYSQSLSHEDYFGFKDDNLKKTKNQTQNKQTKAIDFVEKDGYMFKTADEFFGKTEVQPQNQNNKTMNDLGTTHKKNVHTKTFIRDKNSQQKYDMRLIQTNIPSNQPVYIYASQRLNWYQKQNQLMRQKIKQDKNHIYTTSKDFLGLSIDPYHLQQERKRQVQLSNTKNFSTEKFSSLLIRTKQQRMKLSKQPGAEDIENMIKYPYHEEKRRELEMKRSQRDKPIDNGKEDFKKYIKKKDVFSRPQVLEVEKMARVEEQRLMKEEKKKREEEERKKLLGESYIKVKKGYFADVVSGIDKFTGILQGSPTKKGLIDYHKKTKQKRPVHNYEVSLFQKQKRDDPSFNPLIRRDDQKLNIGGYEFNNYQKPQVLTQTGIYKPLKQN